jgi:hypothetical protein
MPTRYTKQGEVQQLQYETTNEIKRDAAPIASGVFGNNALHPDMASISNAEIDTLYRQKYAAQDREWLMQEAQRDPEQFLKVTDRIGVPDPPQTLDAKPTSSTSANEALAAKLHAQAQQNAAQAAPSLAASPGMVAAPAVVPPPVPAALPLPPPPGQLPGPLPPPPPGPPGQPLLPPPGA